MKLFAVIGLLAAGGFVAANAATITTSPNQDLVLSFDDNNNTNRNLEVDLGSFTQFTNGTSFSVVGSNGLSFADLTSIYDTNAAQLFFSVIGTTGTGSGSNGVRGDTLFATGAPSTQGTTDGAPSGFFSQSGQAAAAGNVVTYLNGLNNRTSTTNSTRSASILANDSGSFFNQSGEASNGQAGPYFQIMQNPPFLTATNLSGGSVRADLYEILPSVNAQTPGAVIDEGFFTLSNGDLFYNSLQAVPEPSTIAAGTLTGLALVLGAARRLRKTRI
jgi:hypothetical protein